MPIPLRSDFDAASVRQAARESQDGNQVRRLLSLAAIYEGATRTRAAEIRGVTLQIVRDWVLKFMRMVLPADRPSRAGSAVAPQREPSYCAGGGSRSWT